MAGRGALGPGEVIQAGSRLFGERWRDLLKIGAVAILPVTIAGLIAITPFTPDVVGDIIANESTPAEIERRVEEVGLDEWIRWGVAYGIFVIASWLVTTLAFGASIVLLREHLAGSPVGVSHAFRAASRRLGSLLALALVAGFLSAIGFLFCLLPGVWLVTSWIVAPVAMFHEDRGALGSMGRSYRLVRDRFWPTLLVVLLLFLALALGQNLVSGGLAIVLAPLQDGSGTLFFAVLMAAGSLVWVVAMGLHAAIATELYLDLVARFEGVHPSAPVPPPQEAFA